MEKIPKDRRKSDEKVHDLNAHTHSHINSLRQTHRRTGTLQDLAQKCFSFSYTYTYTHTGNATKEGEEEQGNLTAS